MAAEETGAYQLEQPTLDEAHAALQRLYGPHTADVWRTLLHKASLTGAETEPWAFDRLVATMTSGDPVTQICAQGLAIRSRAYARLVAEAKQKAKAEAKV
ncbi:MAG: hypothetical protein ABW022_19480 [Actinoplanes sp.]